MKKKKPLFFANNSFIESEKIVRLSESEKFTSKKVFKFFE